MSPEQWGEIPRDGDSEIDGRADIPSLGIVGYEMIVCIRPYSGTTLFELRRTRLRCSATSLRTVPGVPRAFGDAITQATARRTGVIALRPPGILPSFTCGCELGDAVGFDRTIPDIPRAIESESHTSAFQRGTLNADVDAPTILT